MIFKPFPHIIIDDFIDIEAVRTINNEWPTEMRSKDGKTSKKSYCETLAPTARKVYEQISLDWLGGQLGIEKLRRDPLLFGAGHHAIERGGFLKTHVDFNQHPRGWHRRVNLLIYLNEGWRAEWKGQLILGKNCEKSIEPVAGRCVMFETTEDSWHGHPEPLECPDGVQRRSLAFYYYTEQPPNAAPHTTIYL